jgi:hypothetical protein
MLDVRMELCLWSSQFKNDCDFGEIDSLMNHHLAVQDPYVILIGLYNRRGYNTPLAKPH